MASNIENLEFKEISKLPATEDDTNAFIIVSHEEGGINTAKKYPLPKKASKEYVLSLEQKIKALESKATNDKGYFSTQAKLIAAHPIPIPGNYANVAGIMYECEVRGTWINTGNPAPNPELNLDDYAENGGSEKTLKEVDRGVDIVENKVQQNLFSIIDLKTYNTLLGITNLQIKGKLSKITSLRISYIDKKTITGVLNLQIIFNINDIISGSTLAQSIVLNTVWVDNSIITFSGSNSALEISFKYDTSKYRYSFNLQTNISPIIAPTINKDIINLMAYTGLDGAVNVKSRLSELIGTISSSPIRVGNFLFMNRNNRATAITDFVKVSDNRKLSESYLSINVYDSTSTFIPDFIKGGILYGHNHNVIYKYNLNTKVISSVTLSSIVNPILFIAEIYNNEFIIFEKTIQDATSPNNPSVNDKIGGIWTTSGGFEGTVTKRHTYKNRYIQPQARWSFDKNGNRLYFAEYGNSSSGQYDDVGLVGTKGRATCAYMSTNNGTSWTKIFDGEVLPAIFPDTKKGYMHIHSIHFDPDFYRIWITTGDGDGGTPLSNKNICYSDDSGSSWKAVNLSNYFGTAPNDASSTAYDNIQFLQMYTDSNILLAFSDNWRQGVYRSIKLEKGDVPTFEHAYALPIQNDITHFSNQFYRANASQPIIICTRQGDSATAEGLAARNILVLATWDGITYYTLVNIPNTNPFSTFVHYLGANEYVLVVSKGNYYTDVDIYKLTMPAWV